MVTKFLGVEFSLVFMDSPFILSDQSALLRAVKLFVSSNLYFVLRVADGFYHHAVLNSVACGRFCCQAQLLEDKLAI